MRSRYAPPVVHTGAHPAFSVAVDVVALTIRADELCALAVSPRDHTVRAPWALPGGLVLESEDLEDAAARQLAEETSVSTGGFRLEQLATFGRPDRDPRHRVVSVAFLVVMPHGPEPTVTPAGARWLPVAQLLEPAQLAFDHDEMLGLGLERARAKLEYTGLATAFVAEEFTVAELRRVYEVMWGRPLDPGNFHRKVTRTAGFVVPTGRFVTRGPGRPAELFRPGDAEVLHPPLSRATFG